MPRAIETRPVPSISPLAGRPAPKEMLVVKDQSHLNAIVSEAEGIVNNALNLSKGRASAATVSVCRRLLRNTAPLACCCTSRRCRRLTALAMWGRRRWRVLLVAFSSRASRLRGESPAQDSPRSREERQEREDFAKKNPFLPAKDFRVSSTGSVKFCNMAGTAMPRCHRGTGVSPWMTGLTRYQEQHHCFTIPRDRGTAFSCAWVCAAHVRLRLRNPGVTLFTDVPA